MYYVLCIIFVCSSDVDLWKWRLHLFNNNLYLPAKNTLRNLSAAIMMHFIRAFSPVSCFEIVDPYFLYCLVFWFFTVCDSKKVSFKNEFLLILLLCYVLLLRFKCYWKCYFEQFFLCEKCEGLLMREHAHLSKS